MTGWSSWSHSFLHRARNTCFLENVTNILAMDMREVMTFLLEDISRFNNKLWKNNYEAICTYFFEVFSRRVFIVLLAGIFSETFHCAVGNRHREECRRSRVFLRLLIIGVVCLYGHTWLTTHSEVLQHMANLTKIWRQRTFFVASKVGFDDPLQACACSHAQ